MALVALSGDEQRITGAETERQQSEMVSVPSLFREAVQVTPVADGVDALPAVSGVGSMVALPDELLQHIFTQLCNVLDPRAAVYLSSVSNELRTATQALLPQLRADHEAAAALCRKVGLRSCKELREVKRVSCRNNSLTAADLALLGTLGSLLPALERLILSETSAGTAGPDGVQRLAAGLGAGALPAVTMLAVNYMHVGDAGASALAAALGRGALPRLEFLSLNNAAIGDAGLVALAPALRRLPALEVLNLWGNLLGDEGLAALVAPPPTAGALPPPTGGLKKLKCLDLSDTQVTNAGCAALAAALDSGALPAFKELYLYGIPASAAAQATVDEALKSRATVPA
eukprot:scaffold14247_cov67-Phaeocystis_antarctica.AAC.1